MTKIAISSKGQTLNDEVDMRFGRCPYFIIVEVEDEQVSEPKLVKNEGMDQTSGAGPTAAEIVGNEEVDTVITGNMGPRAFSVINQLEIEVYRGEGKISEVIEKFKQDNLEKIHTPGPMHRGLNK